MLRPLSLSGVVNEKVSEVDDDDISIEFPSKIFFKKPYAAAAEYLHSLEDLLKFFLRVM